MSKLFGNERAAKPHLVRGGGGISGEIVDLRGDIERAFSTLEDGSLFGLLVTEEFINVPAADPDALRTTTSTSGAPAEFTAAMDFDGVSAGAELVPPRNVTITTSAHADVDAVAVEVTGRVRNADGDLVAQTDTFNLTDGGGVTDAGAAMFSFVDSITIEAQSGNGGTLQIGFGVLIGLANAIKARAGFIAPIREIAAGAIVTTGTFTSPATNSPYGAYTPATAANGTNDYAITYEVDASV